MEDAKRLVHRAGPLAVREPLAGNVARILALHRRALCRTVGTENAAITGLRAKQRVTARALVKELARVDGHGFTLRETADRTN